MPSLLQINSTLNWGSTGHIAEQIALLAEEKGWKCYIAHGARYVRESTIKSLQISSKWDNYIHAFLSFFMGGHGLGSIIATHRFVKQLNVIQPDIIHIHNIHGYYINYPILFNYLKKTSIPVVWTLHDCWPMTGQCTHFETVGCNKWIDGCKHCPLLNASYKTIVDCSQRNWLTKKEVFSGLDKITIVTVSDWLKNVVEHSFLKHYPVHVIPNGVNLNVFKPMDVNRSELGLKADKVCVLGVSSEWGAKKGLNDFIRLAENPNYQVVLIGLTEKQIECLPPHIVAIRRTSSQVELAKYYSVADVFVNPTYEDSFPTVNLEALACGTPVVTYCTGGSPESIDEETGIVVGKGDIQGLFYAIDKLAKSGNKDISTICRQRAEKQFDKDDRFNDYIRLYNSLL